MAKTNFFNKLDDFSRFFQHCGYQAYHSKTEPDSYMLMNTGSTSPIVIMLTPQQVTIHRGYDTHFYSCPREEWGPDFLEKCGRKDKSSRIDYETIAKKYRSYCTLDVLGKYLVDECGLRVEIKKSQNCRLEQNYYDIYGYYTLTIDFGKNPASFNLQFEISPFNKRKSEYIKYDNMTNWSAETLDCIGKELPLRVLNDYIKKYKKTVELSENVDSILY